MKRILPLVISLVLFAAGVLYLNYSSAELYAEQSLGSYGQCLKQAIDRDESPEFCSQTKWAADSAFRAARHQLDWLSMLIILLFGGTNVLAYKLGKLKRELYELKESLND